jgi:adenine C2-methylase RlmN of 23S rRNA A2503 and tRNA A37
MFKEIKTIQSKDENVMKFVFTKENAVAEAVLYKYPTYEARTVICCSTMSGCPVGCRFCGAGADERDNKVNTIIPLLNEIHAELAKSNLPAEQYQLISAMIIDVKQLVKPTIPHHLNNNL